MLGHFLNPFPSLRFSFVSHTRLLLDLSPFRLSFHLPFICFKYDRSHPHPFIPRCELFHLLFMLCPLPLITTASLLTDLTSDSLPYVLHSKNKLLGSRNGRFAFSFSSRLRARKPHLSLFEKAFFLFSQAYSNANCEPPSPVAREHGSVFREERLKA